METADTALSRLAVFLETRLRQPLPGSEAHWRFAPRPSAEHWSPELTPDSARQAAVLILLFPGVDGPSIPLTLRHPDLPQHAGQISLPGGAIDAGESPESAALREAHEEIGVEAADVRVLGALSPIWTYVSNFIVHPIVAMTSTGPTFRLYAPEVSALVVAPVTALCDPARLKWFRRDRNGTAVDFPYFDIHGHVVWGLTAMILGEFGTLLGACDVEPSGPRQGAPPRR